MATKTIKVDYIARVEGEGALDLEIADGRVTSAELRIFEPPRFFEAMLRGRGYMVGIQLTSDPASMVGALREAGLLVPSAGGNVIRLLPPLTAAPEELSQSVEIIRAVLAIKA